MPINKSLRKWPWSYPTWYNGFSPTERVRGWQIFHWVNNISDGNQLPCSVCGNPKAAPHNENYYEPWGAKHVCKSCHTIIHKRFHVPVSFSFLASKYPDSWLAQLTTDITYDLAHELIEEHGSGIIQVHDRIPVPRETLELFPVDQLIPLETEEEWVASHDQWLVKHNLLVG